MYRQTRALGSSEASDLVTLENMWAGWVVFSLLLDSLPHKNIGVVIANSA